MGDKNNFLPEPKSLHELVADNYPGNPEKAKVEKMQQDFNNIWDDVILNHQEYYRKFIVPMLAHAMFDPR